MDEFMPGAVVLVVESDKADLLLADPSFKNTDAIGLLNTAKTMGGFAVFTGPIWSPGGGVFGGWSADAPGLMKLVHLVHARLDHELSDSLSQWMVFTNEKVKKRVTSYIQKKNKFH